MANEGRHSEAHYARIEIFETNRNHTPWVNIWTLVSLALIAAYYITGRTQLLEWVPWANVAAVALMIRAEALVRRHWQLYLVKSGEKEVTPDNPSRRDVGVGNLLGLLFQLLMVVYAYAYHAWSAYALDKTDMSVIVLGTAAFAFSVTQFVWTGVRKPTFPNQG